MSTTSPGLKTSPRLTISPLLMTKPRLTTVLHQTPSPRQDTTQNYESNEVTTSRNGLHVTTTAASGRPTGRHHVDKAVPPFLLSGQVSRVARQAEFAARTFDRFFLLLFLFHIVLFFYFFQLLQQEGGAH